MKKTIIIQALLIATITCFGQFQNTISQSEKIFGLSKIWQEVNYNFANFDNVSKLNWDSAYISFIPKVIQTQNDLEYYKTLKRFCALLKDGHTSVNFPKEIDTCLFYTQFGDYYIYLKNVNNKAIVVHVNKSKKDEIPIGSEIIEVNNQPTEKYLKDEIIPFISASTDYAIRDWAVKTMLMGFKGQKLTIKIKTPSEEIKTLSLVYKKTQEKEIYPPFYHDIFKFKWLDNQIAYVALNSFVDAKVDSLFSDKLPELRKAYGLILDVRNNGGGSSDYGAAIAQYLSPDSLIYASKGMTRTNNALYRARGSRYTEKDTIKNDWAAKTYLCYHNKSMGELGTDTWRNDIPLKDRIIIPTVVLFGHETGSAAEEFLLFLDKSKQITKMGQNSYGSNGQPYLIDLPAGGTIRICTQQLTYPDGRKYVGCGVKPDIEIKETVEDIVNNRDIGVLEAVKYLQTSSIDR
jgi:C-terminal processing protease CtpA/Prc